MTHGLVLVIGGSRSTGLQAARALYRDGLRVRILARDPAAASMRIRSSGFDYTIVRAAFLLDRPRNRRAIRVRQVESALTLHECVARADVAEALVAAVHHPDASRATFDVTWDRGPRQESSWSELLAGLRPDEAGQ